MKQDHMKKVHMKNNAISFLLVLFFAYSSGLYAGDSRAVVEREDWKGFFDKYDAAGTIVVVDARDNRRTVSAFNATRGKVRYAPASTFKVPHSLFALEEGVVKDEFQVFKWDGIERSFAPHNQDQNLRSAMRNSAVWVYDIFAQQIGEKRARKHLKEIHYGNADPSSKAGSYWIEGNLSISAFEQADFLQKLYKNTLPFRVQHQLLVKDIMIVQAEKDWILRAKTGWEGRYGWWVGWVEVPAGPIFFALNIDTPDRLEDLYKREAIVRDILISIQALPSRG
jgi:beta-lactamase class D